MVRLGTNLLLAVCFQLAWITGILGAKCQNSTELCQTAGENTCTVGSLTVCCINGQVIRAVSTDQGALVSCNCHSPSPSNTGHRCTVKSYNVTGGSQRIGISTDTGSLIPFLACVLYAVITLLLVGYNA